MPVDTATQALLAQLAELRSPPIHESTPALARLIGPIGAAMSGPGPAVGSTQQHTLAGKDGSFRIRVLQPEATPRALLVYFHGGGWVIGDIDMQYDHVGRDLVNRTDATVVMVNYRKAPEHPFPAAIEDSYAALQWVEQQRANLAPAGAPLIVAGDSAGGNIAAVMTRWARDNNGPKIDYQVLIYPVTDCDFDRPSYHDPNNQLLLDRAAMQWFWDHYLPDEQARSQPDAAPIRAASLAGLPPALVYLAECDPLHDEGLAYAQALRDAGVVVAVEQAQGQMHAYFQMANVLPGYETGMQLVSNYINDFVAAHTA